MDSSCCAPCLSVSLLGDVTVFFSFGLYVWLIDFSRRWKWKNSMEGEEDTAFRLPYPSGIGYGLETCFCCVPFFVDGFRWFSRRSFRSFTDRFVCSLLKMDGSDWWRAGERITRVSILVLLLVIRVLCPSLCHTSPSLHHVDTIIKHSYMPHPASLSSCCCRHPPTSASSYT